MHFRRPSLRAVGIAILSLSVGPTALQAQTAGTIGAVNTAATGQPPGSSPRSLSLGQSVVQNERIATNPTGTVNIMFNDRSTLNVGRNSAVVIDRFVYDPGQGAGEMAVSLAKGAARLVGGQVSHDDQATVKTPVATVGVRGGTATIVHAGGSTLVMVHFGSAFVSNSAGGLTVRAGMQAVVTPDGPPSQVNTIDLDALRDISRGLESQERQTGGALTLPTDEQAAANSVGLGRPAVRTPNFDMPNAGDRLNKGYADTLRQIVTSFLASLG